jgi:4-hydroxy-2-oxoheptanedioate aldolase
MADAPADLSKLAVWLSTTNHWMVEVARDLGIRRFVLDIEHGLFDLSRTDALVAFIKAQGLEAYLKVLGPDMVPIQQALDLGCDGVIIPHIEGVEHARRVTAAAKYPPVGIRSFAGGRTSRYGGADDAWYASENQRCQCYPMIESAAALADIDAILALPTVDGLFVGPSDLSLSRGRGAYKKSAEDEADLRRIAAAAAAAGKPWIMPAWTAQERRLSAGLGAHFMVVADEFGSIWRGLSETVAETKALGILGGTP